MNKNNTGNNNVENWNTGDRNTGYYNTGNHNAGHHNTGDWNTGSWNTGSCNRGSCNTGSCNTGNWNKCNYSTGHFNIVEQPFYMFNRPVAGVSRHQVDVSLAIQLTEWVLPEDMTEQEKKENPSWETSEGYLKERSFEEACQIAWKNADQETKKRFLNLPNFNPEIFKEITGIDVRVKK